MKPMAIPVPTDWKQRLKQQADKQGMSLADYVRKCLVSADHMPARGLSAIPSHGGQRNGSGRRKQKAGK